jgi:hypothetical protein
MRRLREASRRLRMIGMKRWEGSEARGEEGGRRSREEREERGLGRWKEGLGGLVVCMDDERVNGG